MDISSVESFLQNLKTDKILDFVFSLDATQLVQSPAFLAGLAVLSLIALFLKWHLMLAAILSLAGGMVMMSFAHNRQAPAAGIDAEALMVFFCVPVAIIFLVIYLLFIKEK